MILIKTTITAALFGLSVNAVAAVSGLPYTANASQSSKSQAQTDQRARIQRNIEEIIEKGCGPLGSLESLLQAQYERGERKYPPIRLHVLIVAKKLEGTDEHTFLRLGSEVLRYRDEFRSGEILMTDFGNGLQQILEQI